MLLLVHIYIYTYVSNVLVTRVNNVLLVKIEVPVWYTIYHHLLVVKGLNQPTNGKGHL